MIITFTLLLCVLLFMLLFIVFLFVRLIVDHERPGTDLLTIIQSKIADVKSQLKECKNKQCEVNYNLLKDEIVNIINNHMQFLHDILDDYEKGRDIDSIITADPSW